MITLTVDNVLAALADVVEDTGADYQYVRPSHHNDGTPRLSLGMESIGSCYYVHTPIMRGLADGPDEIGCIVGRVLVKLGMPLATLAQAQKDYNGPAGVFLTDLARRGIISGVTGQVTSILAVAQQSQDNHGTYGTALARARATAKRVV